MEPSRWAHAWGDVSVERLVTGRQQGSDRHGDCRRKSQEAGQYIGVIELVDGVGEFVGLVGVGIRHGCLR